MNKIAIISLLFVFCLLFGCRAILVPRSQPGNAAKIISLAKQMIGAPYRYGGRTPQGFDCSGLVQYVYKKALGKRLPRTSAGLYAYSKHVPLGQEQPSDLLFFRINGNKISHVGIYLGKGNFIHAPSSGKKVKQSNGNDKYWRKRFAGVRRLIR